MLPIPKSPVLIRLIPSPSIPSYRSLGIRLGRLTAFEDGHWCNFLLDTYISIFNQNRILLDPLFCLESFGFLFAVALIAAGTWSAILRTAGVVVHTPHLPYKSHPRFSWLLGLDYYWFTLATDLHINCLILSYTSTANPSVVVCSMACSEVSILVLIFNCSVYFATCFTFRVFPFYQPSGEFIEN